MAKNQSDSSRSTTHCPIDLCRKMYKAVAVSPAFNTIRRICSETPRQPQKEALPAQNPTPVLKRRAIDILQTNKGGENRVEQGANKSVTNSSAKIGARNSMVAEFNSDHVMEGRKKVERMHIEDRFTDFINRTRFRITRTTSRDYDSSKGKDEFTEYINRAKVKLRTTSSIHGGKNSA